MHRFARPLLIIAFGLETFCATYGLKAARDAALTGILYFIAGVSVALLAIFLRPAKLPSFQKKIEPISLSVKLICIAGIILLMYIIARYWFDKIPIDTDYADMLPVIRVMNERFLAGHWKMVYDPITEIWNGVKPVYMPAMWLPYAPSLLLHADMRWTTVVALFLSFSAFLWLLRIHKQGVYPAFLLGIAFMLFWWLFARDDVHGLLSLSEEGVVIFYYTALVLSILSGNMMLIALAVSLCLLSRYALIGWLPAFLIFLIWKKQYRQIRIFLITCIAVCFLFFILPFGPAVFQRLLYLPGNYISFAARVWSDSPEVFWLSPGFAKFFGSSGTRTLHALLIGLSFGIPVLFMLFCILRSRKVVLHNIPLATLKLSIVFFYNFIDVPYLYLFYTSGFVSLIMVTALTFEGSRPPIHGR